MDEAAEIARLKTRIAELEDVIKALVEERQTSYKMLLALGHELNEERKRVLELKKQLGQS